MTDYNATDDRALRRAAVKLITANQGRRGDPAGLRAGVAYLAHPQERASRVMVRHLRAMQEAARPSSPTKRDFRRVVSEMAADVDHATDYRQVLASLGIELDAVLARSDLGQRWWEDGEQRRRVTVELARQLDAAVDWRTVAPGLPGHIVEAADGVLWRAVLWLCSPLVERWAEAHRAEDAARPSAAEAAEAAAHRAEAAADRAEAAADRAEAAAEGSDS